MFPLVGVSAVWENLWADRPVMPRVRCCATSRWGLGLGLALRLRKRGLLIYGRLSRRYSNCNTHLICLLFIKKPQKQPNHFRDLKIDVKKSSFDHLPLVPFALEDSSVLSC
jgi:hypothetical protein